MIILLARLVLLLLILVVFGACGLMALYSTVRLITSDRPPKKKKRKKTKDVPAENVATTYARTPMTKQVADAVQTIECRLHQLAQDLEWLDVEARHAVQETYPADVKRLITHYHVITDKEAVQKEVLAIFNELDVALTQLEQTVENRKQHVLQREALIVTTRNQKNL